MPTQTTLSRVESFPFDSRSDGYDSDGYPVYDRAVGAGLLRSTFEKFFSDGVFPSPGNALQIAKGSGLTVTIQPGIFIINGAMGGYLTDAHSLTLDTAAPQGNVAYGIMLRYDENEQHRSCYLRVVRGDAASSPQPPAPDQSTPGVMEYRLGYVTVPSGATDLTSATVTNEKGLAVCPYAAPFEKIDMSEVTADARNAANEALTHLLAYFESNREAIDAALSGEEATHLQLQITALQEQLADFDVDLASKVDNLTIEYTGTDNPVDPEQLRVKKLSLSKGYLSTDLQTELGILDVTGWEFQDWYDAMNGKSLEVQQQVMGLMPNGEINEWTPQQIVQMFSVTDPSIESELVGELSQVAVSSWDPSGLASVLDVVTSSEKTTIESKVSDSAIKSWPKAGLVDVLNSCDEAFASRCITQIELDDFQWADLDDVFSATPAGARSKFVGKTKTAQLTTYGSHPFEIVGVSNDKLASGGTASLSFMSVNILYTTTLPKRYSWDTYKDTYSANVWEKLPLDLQQSIKEVTKHSRKGDSWCSTNDRVWIPSEVEVGASTNEGEAGYADLYDRASSGGNTWRSKKYNSSTSKWFTRSADPNYSRSCTFINEDGSVSGGNAPYNIGVVCGFCI